MAIDRLIRRFPDLSLAIAPDQLTIQVRRRQPGAWRLVNLPLRLARNGEGTDCQVGQLRSES